MVFKDSHIMHFDADILSKVDGSRLYALIQETFNDEEQLSFAFLQFSYINGGKVDEIHYCSRNNYKIAGFYKTYQEKMKSLANEVAHGLFMYEEWYRFDQYYWLQVENKIKNKQLKQDKLNWETFDALNDYQDCGSLSGITQDEIEQYQKSISNEVNFIKLKENPYSITIILPLADVYNNQIIPRANVHMHFGLNKSVSEDVIKKFIVKFNVVYDEIERNFYRDSVNRISSIINHNETYDKFRWNDFGDTYNGAIQFLTTKFFSSKINVNRIKIREREFINDLMKLNSEKDYTNAFPILKETPSVINLISKYTHLDFENFIFRRAFVCFLMISQELDIDSMRTIIMDRGTEPEKDKSKYFNHYVHINITKKVSIKELSKCVKAYLRGDLFELNAKQMKVVEKFLKPLSEFEKDILKKFSKN